MPGRVVTSYSGQALLHSQLAGHAPPHGSPDTRSAASQYERGLTDKLVTIFDFGHHMRLRIITNAYTCSRSSPLGGLSGFGTVDKTKRSCSMVSSAPPGVDCDVTGKCSNKAVYSYSQSIMTL